MRTIKWISAVTFVVMLFVGCSASTEISKRELVDILGIDYYGNNFCVTAEALKVSDSSSENAGQYNLYTSYGSTIYEAFKALENSVTSDLFFKQTNAVVLGKGAYDKTEEIMKEIALNQYASVSANVFCTRETAKEFVNALSSFEKNGGQMLGFLANNKDNDYEYSCPLFQFDFDMESCALQNAFIPIIELATLSEDQQQIVCKSLLLIKEGKDAAILPENLTKAILTVQNKANKVDMFIQYKEETVVCSFFNPKNKLSYDIYNKNFTISCSSTLMVNQNKYVNDMNIKAIESYAVKNYENYIFNTIKEMKYHYNVDILNFNWFHYQNENRDSKILKLHFNSNIKTLS